MEMGKKEEKEGKKEIIMEKIIIKIKKILEKMQVLIICIII